MNRALLRKIKRWMWNHEYDSATELAEAAADEFNAYEANDDIPDEIYDLAAEVHNDAYGSVFAKIASKLAKEFIASEVLAEEEIVHIFELKAERKDGRVYFTGSPTGNHDVADDGDKRWKAHWKGYVDNANKYIRKNFK